MDWSKIVPDLVANSPWVALVMLSMWWFATHVATPLVKAHTKFLEGVVSNGERTDRWLQSNTNSLSVLADQSKTQTHLLEKIVEEKRERGR